MKVVDPLTGIEYDLIGIDMGPPAPQPSQGSGSVPIGVRGATGTTGYTGPTGPGGTTGYAGPTGPTGPARPGGITGATGASNQSTGAVSPTLALPRHYSIGIDFPLNSDENKTEAGVSGPIAFGLFCRKCKDYYPHAESNQKDGTLLCYSCRTYG